MNQENLRHNQRQSFNHFGNAGSSPLGPLRISARDDNRRVYHPYQQQRIFTPRPIHQNGSRANAHTPIYIQTASPFIPSQGLLSPINPMQASADSLYSPQEAAAASQFANSIPQFQPRGQPGPRQGIPDAKAIAHRIAYLIFLIKCTPLEKDRIIASFALEQYLEETNTPRAPNLPTALSAMLASPEPYELLESLFPNNHVIVSNLQQLFAQYYAQNQENNPLAAGQHQGNNGGYPYYY